MNIEDGWAFMYADFSLQASGENKPGTAMLVRIPEDKARWHNMSEEDKDADDGPPLYVTGEGFTIEQAIENANWLAARAKPISAAQHTLGE